MLSLDGHHPRARGNLFGDTFVQSVVKGHLRCLRGGTDVGPPDEV